jgi:NAD(P)H dehydrogenase (quinone)
MSDAEWRDAKIAGGMPAIYADMLLGTFQAARNGDFAATDPTLERLLGRSPRTMHDVIAATRNSK